MEEWTSLIGNDHDGFGIGIGAENSSFAFDLEFPLQECRFNSSRERLRGLFYELLVDFLKLSKCIRPIPAFCGDGCHVDLYKLFWVVRKIGGYGIVSRSYLWGFVSEECGLDSRLIPSIKLVYMKYLNEFDQWLQRVSNETCLEDRRDEVLQKLDLLSGELEARFRGEVNGDMGRRVNYDDGKFGISEGFAALKRVVEKVVNESSSFLERKVDDDGRNEGGDGVKASAKRVVEKAMNEANGFFERKVDDDGGNEGGESVKASTKRVVEKAMNEANGRLERKVDDDAGDEEGDLVKASVKKLAEKVISKVHNCEKTVASNDERHYVQDDDNVFVSAKKVVEKAITKVHDISENVTDDAENTLDCRKRKRESESFGEMLKWLSHAAKHSDDPSVGLIPKCSTWNEYGNEELWVQAISVREALMIRKHVHTNAGEHLLKDQQKKPRMHPSMYRDDVPDVHSIEKLRCSKRITIPSPAKSLLCACCNPSQSKSIIRQGADEGNNSPKSPPVLVLADTKEPHANSDNSQSYMLVERQVSLGPRFQAEVPEWTGVPTKSDPKWLGTRMYAREDSDQNSTIVSDPMGKGRQRNPCDCLFEGSVECVRFHIAEKRWELRRELGSSLFYKWRFDGMGEEVSLSWSEEEEKRFKDMMGSFAALSNKFRKNASNLFPSKTRVKLISYYFNVFLVRRRSYQNRVNPKDIDSDDDEKECGSIGGSFGYKALCIPGGSRSISCTLNKDSTEVE